VYVDHVDEMPFQSGPHRKLLVNAYTNVNVDGRPVQGSHAQLAVGDMLYYTGCCQGPDYKAAEVMAITITRMVMQKGPAGA
jgi:hypothetical protein